MQIGLRLHDSAAAPLPERLRTIRSQGFSCVHIALSKTEGCTAAAEALTPGYAMWLKRIFAEAGLDIAVLGNYLNLAHPDPLKYMEIREKYLAHIRFASILGCGMVGTETGAPNERYAYDKESCHSDEALKLFIDRVRPVVRYAEQMGVILAIEPVYKHIVCDPRRARTVLDTIGSPNLQIIFDPVNLLHGDNLADRDSVIGEAIELLGPDIAMIHLKDYVPKEDGSGELAACACGTGQMDYRAVLAFAREKKPYIHATLENTVPENAVAAREFIERLYMEEEGTGLTDGIDIAVRLHDDIAKMEPEEEPEAEPVSANLVLTGCEACTFPVGGELFTVREVYIRGNEVWMTDAGGAPAIGLDCEYGVCKRIDAPELHAPYVIDVTEDKNLSGIVHTLATMYRILSKNMVQDPETVCAKIRDRANSTLNEAGITMRFTPQLLKFIKDKRFITLEEVVDLVSLPEQEVVGEIVESW